MDEKQFLAQMQSKLRLVMGAITNPPEPLKLAAGMVLFRRIDEREFLTGLKHEVDLAATQVAIHPTLEEISVDIQHRLDELG
jgi:hypothetical protein